jgi:hypothetical protein
MTESNNPCGKCKWWLAFDEPYDDTDLGSCRLDSGPDNTCHYDDHACDEFCSEEADHA